MLVVLNRGNDKGKDKDTGKGKGAAIKRLIVPTLDQVNYDTTLGDEMIVFYKQGTGKYNKRVHGGDIEAEIVVWFPAEYFCALYRIGYGRGVSGRWGGE